MEVTFGQNLSPYQRPFICAKFQQFVYFFCRFHATPPGQSDIMTATSCPFLIVRI